MPTLAYVLIALIAALGAAGAWFATPAVTRRAASRPVGLALADESHVIAAVWADPRRLAYLLDLSPEDFSVGVHKRIWEAFTQAGQAQGVLHEDIKNDKQAEQASKLIVENAAAWAQQSANALNPDDLAYLQNLPQVSDDGVSLAEEDHDKAVVASAAAVMDAAMDRTVMNGASLVVPSDTPESTDPTSPPVVRVAAHVTTQRKVIAALAALAWVGSLMLLIPMTGYEGLAAVLAAGSWLVLGAGMGVVAMVDHDTMYIDMQAWLIGTAGAWVLAIAAALVYGDPGRLTAGVVMVLVIALLFEVVNRAYRMIRGKWGQGFGDTLIIIGTVGIPPALTGEWALGYYSVMGALIAAIIGWIIAKAAGRGGKDVPFAFGPWLAAGPMIALLLAPLNLMG